MSGQHSSLQASVTWKKSCTRVGPANGSAWQEAGEEKMQAGVTQLKTTRAGSQMEELNTKNIEVKKNKPG